MRSRTASAAPKSLRVSEVVIVDPQGVERVRIGGDVPDTVIGGKRTTRGAKAAEVLLYDGTGQERAGEVRPCYASWWLCSWTLALVPIAKRARGRESTETAHLPF